MKPYYEAGGVTILHGDARELMQYGANVVVTDPPFGIAYDSGHDGSLSRSIEGDRDTTVRDDVLAKYRENGDPMLVFGSWRATRPAGVSMLLVWDTLGALGMGDLSLPWKPSHQEIYVIRGKVFGFVGSRSSDVIYHPPVQSMACNGRLHPHEKPVGLMKELIAKTDTRLRVVDPFCGVGPTLIAARDLGRKATGIEIEERYCEIAARRLDQALLPFEANP